jgi:molybdate transport system substrate-binding protein
MAPVVRSPSEPRSRTAYLFLALAACVPGCKRAREPLRVAAASDLASAFPELGAAYEAKTGQAVTFSFGSTGLLAQQIREGAPFDVLAAANVSYVDEVTGAGACDAATKALYARGRLVLVTAGASASKPRALADLGDPGFQRIAIANPEHAPYGMAAKQALERAGIWDRIQARLVYGENIQQVLAFARTGNVDAALVALSLVTSTGVEYTAVDPALYDPIDQALVVCKGGKKETAGRGFAAFVGSSEGRAIMRRYGFFLPGETSLP